MTKKYYSQIGQDQYYIENISKFKKNGFFLDIGANDGIHTSNTAALEFDYGWTGICVEANPLLIYNLTKNRPNSKIVNCAVWDTPGEIEFEIPTVNAHGVEGHLLSRISNLERNENYFRSHFAQNTTRVTVPSNTVTNILEQYHNLPCVIDYLSIDTEGAEYEALKSIDFDRIDVKFMTIEHGDRPGYIEQFAGYLAKFGFKIHRINQWDVEFEK